MELWGHMASACGLDIMDLYQQIKMIMVHLEIYVQMETKEKIMAGLYMFVLGTEIVIVWQEYTMQ